MKITILAVGKMKETYFAQATNEYHQRLKNYGEITIDELPDEANDERIKQRLQHPSLNNAVKIALSITGKRFTSAQLASYVQNERDKSRRLVFVIGGSEGLSEGILQLCPLHISFSDMTFPHRLFRVMLLEQLYRACKIITNEPYHK